MLIIFWFKRGADCCSLHDSKALALPQFVGTSNLESPTQTICPYPLEACRLIGIKRQDTRGFVHKPTWSVSVALFLTNCLNLRDS